MADSILTVNEKFLSLQGESTHAGRLCYFIRLAGCNLSCHYCDTVYARDNAAGNPETIESLVTAAKESGCKLVEITGGEPLVSKACPELCKTLIDAGFEVLVETNGSFDICELPKGTIRILDCKTPSSGESNLMYTGNYAHLTERDEVKFVISDRKDYEYSCGIINQFDLTSKTKNLIFSPAWGSIQSQDLAEWMIEDRCPARMQLQMHKYVWGPDKQGV